MTPGEFLFLMTFGMWILAAICPQAKDHDPSEWNSWGDDK